MPAGTVIRMCWRCLDVLAASISLTRAYCEAASLQVLQITAPLTGKIMRRQPSRVSPLPVEAFWANIPLLKAGCCSRCSPSTCIHHSRGVQRFCCLMRSIRSKWVAASWKVFPNSLHKSSWPCCCHAHSMGSDGQARQTSKLPFSSLCFVVSGFAFAGMGPLELVIISRAGQLLKANNFFRWSSWNLSQGSLFQSSRMRCHSPTCPGQMAGCSLSRQCRSGLVRQSALPGLELAVSLLPAT